jgi:hypothetical protein
MIKVIIIIIIIIIIIKVIIIIINGGDKFCDEPRHASINNQYITAHSKLQLRSKRWIRWIS